MRSLGRWVPDRMARADTWLTSYSTRRLQQRWGSLPYQAKQSEQLTHFCRLASKLIGLKLPATSLRVVGQICCDRPWACQGRVRRASWEALQPTVKCEAVTPLPFKSWCFSFTGGRISDCSLLITVDNTSGMWIPDKGSSNANQPPQVRSHFK